MEWHGELPDNFVHIIGECKRDAESRQVRDGLKAMNFTVIAPDPASNRDPYIDVLAFNEVCDRLDDFVAEGERLCVVGKLTFRTFTDYDGVRRSGKVVVADMVLDKEDMEEGNGNQ